jgi:hypothetical protein
VVVLLVMVQVTVQVQVTVLVMGLEMGMVQQDILRNLPFRLFYMVLYLDRDLQLGYYPKPKNLQFLNQYIFDLLVLVLLKYMN